MKAFALVFLLISSCSLYADASTDTILQGQSITASDNITSAGNIFELGFFSPGNLSSTTNYYVGIWYKRVSEQTVVWVANRDNPFTDSPTALIISADGNLVIVNGRISYMLTNVSSNGNTSATLLDSGNLVLRDGAPGALLWQSFDYPSHTLLPGMKIGYDRSNGKIWSLISWKSREDPGPGKVPDLNAHNLLDIAYFSRLSGNYFTYSVTDASVTSRFVLEISGFEPLSVGSWNAGDMSGGCARKAPLQCGNDSQANGQNDQFLWISKIRLPVNPIVLQVRSAVDCESACFGNCSCSGYVYGSDGCSIWREDLFNMEQLTNDDTDGRDFYLKLAASEFLSNVSGIRTDIA
ncbi:hypothetical protein ACSBR2_011426 [Camellia fascicularis]